MDLVPSRGTQQPQAAADAQRPSLVAYDRDHINALLGELAQVDAAAGAPVAKSRLGGGIVNLDVPAERLVPVAHALRDQLGFEMLTCVSGVDMIDHLEAIYHFRSISGNYLVQVRVQVPTAKPEVDSLVGVYASANWLERETYDMYGIVFLGHPDLRRILLDDEFEGYPLRKDFRPTPLTVHDRATTQVDPIRAIAGEQTRRQERVTLKRLGQGNEERLHPGKTTFGSAAVYLETGQGVEPPGEGSADQNRTTKGER